ncbi:hypothetical protein ACP26L_07585 [Paenibacillus sp. S-38]|uniref:hypothetical protein n=1 Tax=Paenibacillus sp. S-38 TaxID=3416710 RepID=UPI003CE73445
MKTRMDSLWLAGIALAAWWIAALFMPEQPAERQLRVQGGVFSAAVHQGTGGLQSENEYIYREARNPEDPR